MKVVSLNMLPSYNDAQLEPIYRYVDYSGIHVEFQKFKDNMPLCIFGILNNENGKAIAKEMLRWLTETYNVICVYQEPPGDLYEYPALRYAQYFISNSNQYDYCLYIHTKGASNPHDLQEMIRNMWKSEFGSEKRNEYIDLVSDKDNPVVVCPFSGPDRETWYNAFFANKKAWNDVNIFPYKDRYCFEYLWQNHRNTKIIGVLNDKIDSLSVGDVVSRYNKTNNK